VTARVIAIIIPGEPIPKQSFRFRYSGRHFVPARIRAAQDQVAWCAREAMAGALPLSGPVSVTATFARKSRRRVDVDNLWKLVGDALQGIVFENDAQIEYLELTKCHVERLDEAKTIVEVGNIADWSRA
jgi:Holliday junction resolvase RusA-like endonuclease